MEPKLRKPGQTKESKKLNEKLSTALIEILKTNSVEGQEKLRQKLEEKTKEVIKEKKFETIMGICKKNISVHITKNGFPNIYSYTE
jgi:hypothetical protein